MTDQTVYLRTSQREDVLARLRTLPARLANGSDRIGQGFRNGIAFGLLQKVSENLVANSERSNPDVDMHWPELAPSTIAARKHPTKKSDVASVDLAREPARAAKKAYKEALKARAQRVKFEKQKYPARRDALIESGFEPVVARSLARQEVHREAMFRFRDTALTKAEIFGGLSVPILHDTGIGSNALSPVSFDEQSGSYQPPRAGTNPDTGEPVEPIFENGTGEVTVGVRGYMARHHEGDKNLPQRRLWPEPNDWPESWWDHLGEVTNPLVVNAAVELANGAA